MAMKKASADLPRCKWPGSDPLYLAYHDHEWGVPLRDSRALFEMLQLEGAQAGVLRDARLELGLQEVGERAARQLARLQHGLRPLLNGLPLPRLNACSR